MLETVAGPVRLYLQGRKDTVRCIVASLTDESSGDLYEELRRQASGERASMNGGTCASIISVCRLRGNGRCFFFSFFEPSPFSGMSWPRNAGSRNPSVYLLA